jgi:hypothetical protein
MHADITRKYRPFPRRPVARPAMARRGHHPRAALVQFRPARRQPGADRTDGRRAQAPLFRSAGADGLQGDRGRLPFRLADRLRLRARPDRRRPGPGRCGDPGPDAIARGFDPPHLRQLEGRQARHHASLQRHRADFPRSGVRPGPRRPDRAGPLRRAPVRRMRRRTAGHRMDLRVFAGNLLLHRTGFRAGGLRGGAGHLATDAGAQGHPQPAGDRRSGDAQRLRRPDRVVLPPSFAPRRRRSSACIRTTTGAPPSPPPNWR